MNETSIALEVIVHSVESARNAEAGGATRLELCDNLAEGGTTPSAGMIEQVCAAVTIPVHVMIRPRGGDFIVSDEERSVMLSDIAAARSLGADAIVFGALTPEGLVDIETTSALIEAARSMKTTFHRAIDMSADIHRAIDSLMESGVDYVLTSGGRQTALEGIDVIAAMVKQAGDSLRIMAGSGVNESNANEIIQRSGVRDIHSSCRMKSDSPMIYRNPHINMGGRYQVSEYERPMTDSERVKRLHDAIA